MMIKNTKFGVEIQCFSSFFVLFFIQHLLYQVNQHIDDSVSL
jgi:hypothetical protein